VAARWSWPWTRPRRWVTWWSRGVPLTEVGRLLVNGEPTALRYRPCNAEVVTVEAVRRPQQLVSARFVLDVHLDTLARWLRLVGVDAAYINDVDDDALIEQADAVCRVLLTQDRGLLRRRALWLYAYVRGARHDNQSRDVLDRFKPPLAPWILCPACNGPLFSVAKAAVAPAASRNPAHLPVILRLPQLRPSVLARRPPQAT
jgi:uncharacterized protein